MKPSIGQIVAFREGDRNFAAIIVDATNDPESSLAYLQVFTRFNAVPRKAEYSEKLKNGNWSALPKAKQ